MRLIMMIMIIVMMIMMMIMMMMLTVIMTIMMRVMMAGADDSLAPVYKIFSKTELDKDEISQLFRDIKFTHVKPWLAYPEYTTNDDFSHFQLAPGQADEKYLMFYFFMI